MRSGAGAALLLAAALLCSAATAAEAPLPAQPAVPGACVLPLAVDRAASSIRPLESNFIKPVVAQAMAAEGDGSGSGGEAPLAGSVYLLFSGGARSPRRRGACGI